jgi:hypothetical protein
VVGSYEAYIGRAARAIGNGWTLDTEYPFAEPGEFDGCWREREVDSLARLHWAEEEIWNWELAAYAKWKRAPVDLTGEEELWRPAVWAWSPVKEPSRASSRVWSALDAAANVEELATRRDSDDYDRLMYEQGVAALPFLTEIASCFALGLFAAASLRRGDAVRTFLIERPRLRYVGEGRLHADDEPAAVWPDGRERWYWDEVAVPSELAERRNELTAESITAITNQEVRRVVLDRVGWDRFLETADGHGGQPGRLRKALVDRCKTRRRAGEARRGRQLDRGAGRHLPPLLPTSPARHAHRARSFRLDSASTRSATTRSQPRAEAGTPMSRNAGERDDDRPDPSPEPEGGKSDAAFREASDSGRLGRVADAADLLRAETDAVSCGSRADLDAAAETFLGDARNREGGKDMTDGHKPESRSETSKSPNAGKRRMVDLGHYEAPPELQNQWSILLRPKPGSFSPTTAKDTAESDE